MKRGDECWVPWFDAWRPDRGWYSRKWTWLLTSNDRAELRDGDTDAYCEPEDLCRTREECEALIVLRAATEAVAKARDAVVEAARAAAGRWGATPWVPYDEGDSGDITDAVRRLEEAERAEAEARAKLEALR